ncbi:MAG: hypothetical protein ABII64_01980 [Elusimicrobiota bacterium]
MKRLIYIFTTLLLFIPGVIFAMDYLYSGRWIGNGTLGTGSGYNFDGICVNANNNEVYVCGTKNNGADGAASSFYDGYIVRLSSAMTFLNEYDSGLAQWDEFLGIVCDPSGNVYATGIRASQMYTAKFTASLGYVTSNSMNLGNSSYGRGIVRDTNNNFYCIVNTSSGTLVKYDSSLNFISSATYKLGSNSAFYDIAIDTANNIYVCGTMNANTVFLTAKYDTSLVFISSAIWGGTGTPAYGITTDSSCNVYVSGGNNPPYAVKYSPSLVVLASIGCSSHGYGGYDIAVDKEGYIFVKSGQWTFSGLIDYDLKISPNFTELGSDGMWMFQGGSINPLITDNNSCLYACAPGVGATTPGGTRASKELGTPKIYSTTPNTIKRGETLDITVSGRNMRNNAPVTFGYSALKINTTTWIDRETIKLNVTAPVNTSLIVSSASITQTGFASLTEMAVLTSALDIQENNPSFLWTADTNYTDKAVQSSIIPVGDTVTFRVRYYDFNELPIVSTQPILNLYKDSNLILSATMYYDNAVSSATGMVFYYTKNLAAGTYYYNFVASNTYCDSTGTPKALHTFIVDNPAPSVRPTAPATGSANTPAYFVVVYPDKPKFSLDWIDTYSYDPASGYPKLNITGNGQAYTYSLIITGVNKYDVTLPVSLSTGTYSYWFTYKNIHNIAEYSSGASAFVVSKTPNNFSVKGVADNGYTTTSRVKVAWEINNADYSAALAVNSSDLTYKLYFGDDPAAMHLVYEGTNSYYYVENLKYSKTYYWQVIATNKYGVSYTSQISIFNTISLPEKAFNYPNPFQAGKDSTNIIFHMPEAGTADIFIYSLYGEKIVEINAVNLGKGSNQITWDGKDERGLPLFSGAYNCIINKKYAGKEIQDKCKILVIR